MDRASEILKCFEYGMNGSQISLGIAEFSTETSLLNRR